MFTTDYNNIIDKVNSIDPTKYSWNRNFIDGDVTYLSPYISRGVISTKMVFDRLMDRGFEVAKIYKFIQELAWRDYWQQVWIEKGSLIDSDFRHPQKDVEHHQMPKAIIDANTGIVAIDSAIQDFYKTGYLHNHVRMYIASIACNIGKSHWSIPAKWLYYHLLDADWASNALSWQWVAGTNSNKLYYANQENINKYCKTNQQGTFLDVPYSAFENLATPTLLKETEMPELKTELPDIKDINVDSSNSTLIYNFYNLDPLWKNDINANRILLLEPSHFEKYPISPKTIDFIVGLSKNIKDIQIYVGEFDELFDKHSISDIFYKEHPTNHHYKGIQEERDWIFTVKGYYPSFFAFWKKCNKEF
ncbi:MAG: FAD-binding domain-containing protein [Chitinophagales bacterium]